MMIDGYSNIVMVLTFFPASLEPGLEEKAKIFKARDARD